MTQTCHRCGVRIPEGHVICPNCGAPVPKVGLYIRCSHCHRRTQAGLTVCPHCGRDLKSWRPDKWVATISLAILLGLWLFFGNGFHVIGASGKMLTALIPPQITPVTQAVAAVTTAPPTQTPGATPTGNAPGFSVPPAQSAAETATPTPTQTATATSTPTTTPTEAPTATATATETPTPPNPDVYIVKSGDTLSAIAQKVHRSVDALAAYNKISAPTTIQVGQTLQIPPDNYTRSTPTPGRPTATPAPRPTATPSITLAAPKLIEPDNNASFGGENAIIALKWRPLSSGIPAKAEYVVHIGIQVGPNIQQDIDWRLNEAVAGNVTYQAPPWLFGQGLQKYGRAYVWYVEVAMVDRSGDQVKFTPVSQPSEKRIFFWN
ncbi:MAG: hypothetical protein DSY55_00725 [Clostridia bacterium]|nr:MAG: hypothetical protein DSY55_00725 [Clostridia bacterium]